MDWTDPTTSEPAEDGEDDMSSLIVGFTTRMRKRALRGRLPPALKYYAASALNGLV